jgi:hypothetical protein
VSGQAIDRTPLCDCAAAQRLSWQTLKETQKLAGLGLAMHKEQDTQIPVELVMKQVPC